MAYQIVAVDDAAPGACVDVGMTWNGTDTLTTTEAISGTSLTLSGAITGGASTDITLNTDKFAVDATNGNTAIAGVCSVTGDLTTQGAFNSVGNLAVNTNKFNVTAASGNTAVAGTMAVTGNTTLSGTLGVSGITTLSEALAAGAASNAATSGFVIVNIKRLYDGYTTDSNADIDASLSTGAAGQLKIVKLELKDVNNLVLTPQNFRDGTTITLDATGEVAVLVCDGTNWNLVYTNGTVA